MSLRSRLDRAERQAGHPEDDEARDRAAWRALLATTSTDELILMEYLLDAIHDVCDGKASAADRRLYRAFVEELHGRVEGEAPTDFTPHLADWALRLERMNG